MKHNPNPFIVSLILVLIVALAAAPPPVGAQDNGCTHVVQAGDTLASIAALYGITVDDLLTLNNLTETAVLQVGQELVLPAEVCAAPAPTSAGLTDGIQGLDIPTATPGQEGFVIPTATPAQDTLAIPTATPGSGLVIPTATPGEPGPAGPSLPLLTTEQLQALTLQANDVPAEFAASQALEISYTQETIDFVREQAPDLADQIEAITNSYGWREIASADYALCQETLPISDIYSEVAQLNSPDAARAFVDDPQVWGIFEAFGYTVTPAANVHGFLAVLPPEPGDCFAQAAEYNMYIEYWGLLIDVAMTADANTDPELVKGLLDQLALAVIVRVDNFAGEPFPPTPVPAATEEAMPTLAPLPTEAGPLPTEALPPTQAAGPGVTLQDVERIMPTIPELGIPADTYAENLLLSGTFSIDEVVNFWQALGLTDIASVLQHNAQQNGAVGQVTRVWDTGEFCPPAGWGISLEADVMLFNTPEGASAFLNDPGYLQAFQAAGFALEVRGSGYLAVLSTPTVCGDALAYIVTAPYSRYVITAQVLTYLDSDEDIAVAVVDELLNFLIQKINQAGLQ
ncbi:MAG: LysM peptidoglycan-binding domain-containing protein [Anaerolineae bacterium]|nr:LysM peptidoglycan-binding domain-containing protein [Anaerolineae bacterium]